MIDEFWIIPFAIGGGLLGILVVVALIAFWIWMIVDCIMRDFDEDLEKIVWVLIILFSTGIGALSYFILVKILYKRGLYRILEKKSKK